MPKRKQLTCSFCGKSESEVAKLVAGPKVYICDECWLWRVESCMTTAPIYTVPTTSQSFLQQPWSHIRRAFDLRRTQRSAYPALGGRRSRKNDTAT
jgi:hypothetical protein